MLEAIAVVGVAVAAWYARGRFGSVPELWRGMKLWFKGLK